MRMRRWLRDAIDHCADRIGILQRYEREMRDGLTVLMYHRVLPPEECADYPLPSLVMPLSCFRAQVEWLAERCTVLPLRDAIRTLGRPRALPLVALTFDDGYYDNAVHAAPLLEEYGLRGSFFVTTGCVENASLLWFDEAILIARHLGLERLSEEAPRFALLPPPPHRPWRTLREFIDALKACKGNARAAFLSDLRARTGAENGAPPETARFRLMSRAQIRGLHDRGHECGSHTVSHVLLPQTSAEEAIFELGASKAWLEELTGSVPAGFCYPNGDASAETRDLVAASGYEYACGTRVGRNRAGCDPYLLRRIDIAPARVTYAGGRYSERAFRAEVSLFHARMR